MKKRARKTKEQLFNEIKSNTELKMLRLTKGISIKSILNKL